ncbi:hypothetical protein EON65_00970 [archaeon]|nr:MAG: hypothetical protein EON65_00970 [archaeon]
MEASTQEAICFFCLSLLPEAEVGFCPSCGSVLFQHSVVSTMTTAAYDPMSREYKPWREKPLLKKRNYKFYEGKLKPWYPASQPRPPKLVKPVKVILSNSVPEELFITNSDAEKDDGVINNELKSSESRSHNHELAMDVNNTEVCSFREVTYPLAAYELFEAPDGSNVLMLVSLIEQLYGKYPMPRVYWLKIVSAFTSTADDTVEKQDEEPEGDMSSASHNNSVEVELRSKCFPFVFLSNAAAAASFPSSEEWLDLEKVSLLRHDS